MDGCLLPVCARCTGIYTGVFLSTGFLFFWKRFNGNQVFGVTEGVIIAMCMFPMIFDGATTYLSFRLTTNLMRILSGALFGSCVPVLYILALRYDVYDVDGKNDRIIVSRAELGILAASCFIFAFLLHEGLLGGWFFICLMICISIFFVFAGLIYICLKKAAGFVIKL